MASYGNFRLTDSGRSLLASVRDGGGGMEFRFLAVGSGVYSPEEVDNIRRSEGLKDERQRVPFASIASEDNGLVTLKACMSNSELTEGYTMTEVGIYAGRKGSEEEILYCITLANNPDYMPECLHGKPFDVIFNVAVGIDDVDEVSISYEFKTYALAEDLNAETLRAKREEEQLKKQTETETKRASKKEADLEEKKLDKDGDASDTVVNFLPAESLEQLQSGKEQKVLYGQLAKAVTELIAHLADKFNPHDTTKEQVGLGNADNTSDINKPVSIAQQAALDALYEQLTAYTLQKIADLINGAPSTLDTLGEIAQAMQANEDVVAALDEAIGKKANAAEFDSHIKDKSNPHKVKATQAEAVSFSESQELSETQKATARANIGAGTSSFSGNYNDLSNLPAIPDISGKVNKSGDIITGQLKREPVDLYYIFGRNGAMIRQNGNPGSYAPVFSSKTGTGSWDMGAIDDIMHFLYISDEEYEKGINGSAAADIVFRSNGTIGATADNADMLDGKHASDFIGADGYADRLGKNGFIVYPKGGYLNLQSQQSITGYLRVTLPQLLSDTMIKFTVSIYNYEENTSVDYIISGYIYSQDTKWLNKTAVCVGRINNRLANLPVGFGVYGNKYAVEIGWFHTNWNHPVVVVHDIVVGFTGEEYGAWSENWDLRIDPNGMPVSAYGGLIENPNLAYNVGNADTVDNYHSYQIQNCSTAGTPEATHSKLTYNPTTGRFVMKAYNSSGDVICGTEVENADMVDGMHIKIVSALPTDAASHPDTLYIIPE